MRSSVHFTTIAALLGLASASPIVESADLVKRGDCSAQTPGNGPHPAVDTPWGFLSDSYLQNLSLQAVAPNDHFLVFQNQWAASSQPGYIRYVTLTNYDAVLCSQIARETPGTVAFNIYFERDPLADPGPGCPNPASTTNIKCALYSEPLSPEAVTNRGQLRDEFEVVIAGSNGYNLETSPVAPSWEHVDGYDGPTWCGTKLLNLTDGFISNVFYSASENVTDVAQRCGTICNAITSTGEEGAYLNHQDYWTPCNEFNSYEEFEGGSYIGAGCNFYSKPWDPYYCTDTTYGTGAGQHTFGESKLYTADPQNAGHI